MQPKVRGLSTLFPTVLRIWQRSAETGIPIWNCKLGRNGYWWRFGYVEKYAWKLTQFIKSSGISSCNNEKCELKMLLVALPRVSHSPVILYLALCLVTLTSSGQGPSLWSPATVANSMPHISYLLMMFVESNEWVNEWIPWISFEIFFYSHLWAPWTKPFRHFAWLTEGSIQKHSNGTRTFRYVD